MFQFEFYNPVRTVFGTGTFETAGRRIADLGTHALLVNYRDPGPLRPVLEKAARLCKEAGVAVTEFFAFEENPAVETVAEGVALARRQGCDVVVGIGGGSVMDGAKAIAAGCHYEGDLWDMVYHRHDGSGANIAPPKTALPTMMIPTLPATGSEMNMCSVLTNRAKREKSYIWAECLFPRVSILDPLLTLSLPKFQSACAAADTISHVLEIYINSREDTPLQHSWQEGCMRTVMDNIVKVLDNPADVEARGNLMWTATCAINGWAYPGDGWTPMHQVGHVLTSRHGVNHGSSLCVLMPHWMRYNSRRRPAPYLRFARRVMEVPADGSDEAQIAAGIDHFHAFLKRIGVPTTLGDVGVRSEHLEAIIDDTAKVSFGADGNLACNPVMTRGDIRAVLQSAL